MDRAFRDAISLFQRKDIAGAARLLRRAVKDDPCNADALTILASIENDSGNRERAAQLFERAASARPQSPDGWFNHARALRLLGRHDGALVSIEKAVALAPRDVDTLTELGLILMELRRYEQALACYDMLLARQPPTPNAFINRGVALIKLKRFEEAVGCLDRAIALDPAQADAPANRAIALRMLRRYDEALASFDRALAIEPHHVHALYGRGQLLAENTRYAEAASTFQTLVCVQPDYPYARGLLTHCKMQTCDWAGLGDDCRHLLDSVRAGRRACDPFTLLTVPCHARDQLVCAQTYVADKYPAMPALCGSYDHARIRVAYVSGEFREQATAFLAAELYERHDRERFEVFAISTGFDDGSGMRARLTAAFDVFIDAAAKPDHETAKLMREREIDIAVNLNGYFGHERTGIFAFRPAPIQVNYLGFPGTMGAAYMDYIIADRFVLPQDERQWFSEKAVYLPDSYQVNDSKRRIAEAAPTRAEAGLPDEGFVFCCFNNNHKILPDMLDVWCRLLREVDSSVLWLIEGNAAVGKNLRREAEQRGIAGERLVFAPRIGPADHLARHRLADLFLDSLPHNAHTTTSDALWAGLPVLTCLGTTFAGRVAASLLQATGLPELITRSLDDYEALAVSLARDPVLLAGFRERLTRARDICPLFDIDRFRRHIEAAYTTMWQRHRRGEPPAGFAVDPIAG